MSENMYTMGGGNATAYALWQKQDSSVDAVVTKVNNTYNINVELIDIAENCEVIIAGHKGGRFVTFTNVPYESEEINTTLSDNIDEIRVMVWNSLSGLKPLCDAKVIPSSEFITE